MLLYMYTHYAYLIDEIIAYYSIDYCRTHEDKYNVAPGITSLYLPKGKYCVYPWMVYRLAIVMPPG